MVPLVRALWLREQQVAVKRAPPLEAAPHEIVEAELTPEVEEDEY